MLHGLILYISDHSVAKGEVQMNKLCVFSCVWSVMQCSTAMDILFVMDSSYSVGKGGFERSRHYVLKLCEALDVSTDKVRLHKVLPKLKNCHYLVNVSIYCAVSIIILCIQSTILLCNS